MQPEEPALEALYRAFAAHCPEDIQLLCHRADVEPLFKGAVALADSHRDELGFLPYSALEELLAKEQLWIVSPADRSSVCAVLAFGKSRTTIRIFQLVVRSDRRGTSIGKGLVSALKQLAHIEGVQVIAARVASELPANRFWEGSGFRVVRQVPGGRTSERTINVRVYEVPASGLLSFDARPADPHWTYPSSPRPLLATPIYALDLNVVFDAIRNREATSVAQRLFAAAFSADISLCVSDEFSVELRRTSYEPSKDPILHLALSLPTLPALESASRNLLLSELRPIVFPDRTVDRKRANNDQSDLIHIASCIHFGVRGFITREQAILRSAPLLRERYGVDVVAPIDLLGDPDTLRGSNTFTELQTGDHTLNAVDYRDEDRVALNGLLARLGVTDSSIIDDMLSVGTSTKPRQRVSLRIDGHFAGFASWSLGAVATGTRKAYVLIDESHAGSQAAIDHSLGSILGGAPEGLLTRNELLSSKSQVRTRATAIALGYESKPVERADIISVSKLSFGGWVTPRDWPMFTGRILLETGARPPQNLPTFAESTSTGLLLSTSEDSYKKAVSLMLFETSLSPCILLCPNRPAAIIPIRDKLASELLPNVAHQRPLFSKEAIIHPERAYFCSPSAVSVLAPASIVIFYASGADGGRAEAIAMARITSVGVDLLSQLRLNLLRQGVLTLSDMEGAQGSDTRIGYFTFDSVIVFPKPISYQRLKELGCVGPANLITSQRIDYECLIRIADEARPGKEVAR